MEVFEKDKPMEKSEEFRTYSVKNSSRYKIVERLDAVANGYRKTSTTTINGIGRIINNISCGFFRQIERAGARTSFYQKLSDRESVHRLTIPTQLKVIVWNPMNEGSGDDQVTCDFLWTSQQERVCKLTDEEIVSRRFLDNTETIEEVRNIAACANKQVQSIYERSGFELISFELSLGRLPSKSLVVTGGMTPDKAELRDIEIGKNIPRDRVMYACEQVERMMRSESLIE